MSDFIHIGWSIFIAVATLASLAACLLLLIVASRRRKMAEDNSTGHVFDGDLVEMNNPLPLWWMVLFVLTIVFAVGYVYVYPALGSQPGSSGWTSAGEHDADRAGAAAESAKIYAAYAGMPADALTRDRQAMEIGQRLFLNNCATCHGSDARGSKGFPNLTDTDWMHGGTPQKIEETIALGRTGMMPPMAAAVGSPRDVQDVAQYVLSLAGDAHNPIAAAAGRRKFTACAACHGPDGKGNQALGAPNLADKVWLHGWGEQAVVGIVTQGRTNVMPAHGGRMPPEQIHLLAAYVWGLSQPRVIATR